MGTDQRTKTICFLRICQGTQPRTLPIERRLRCQKRQRGRRTPQPPPTFMTLCGNHQLTDRRTTPEISATTTASGSRQLWRSSTKSPPQHPHARTCTAVRWMVKAVTGRHIATRHREAGLGNVAATSEDLPPPWSDGRANCTEGVPRAGAAAPSLQRQRRGRPGSRR